jgi:hypothetical protein
MYCQLQVPDGLATDLAEREFASVSGDIHCIMWLLIARTGARGRGMKEKTKNDGDKDIVSVVSPAGPLVELPSAQDLRDRRNHFF